MFNVLIVDDEYYICEGIRRKLEHLAMPDIGEARVCMSGEEALELCRTYKPQIVITDIKMGGIDGIELIRRLGERLYPVQFIVLSGYDDFSYVKGAFTGGAVDYLLKPLLTSALKEVMERASENLRLTVPAAKESRAGQFHVSREILSQIAAMEPGEGLTGQLRGFLEESALEEACQIALLASDRLLSLERRNQYINAVYDYLGSRSALLCHAVTESKLCILAGASLTQPLTDFLREWCASYGNFAAAVSGTGGWEQIPELYREAEDSLLRRLTEGYGIFFPHPYNQPEGSISSRLRHLIAQFIKTPSLIGLETMRLRFSEELRRTALPALKTFYIYFNQILDWSLAKKEIPETQSKFRNFSDFHDFQELEEYLFGRLSAYASRTDTPAPEINAVMAVKEYIDAHFTENLTLAELSDHFFISYSHLSRLFQKTYHMKYVEYIYMLRMEYALELLNESELTIHQIAAKTGYDNLFNFSRAFKTYYGIAPSYYRKSTLDL